ncbi:hypothetical protein [Streptomyces sp. NPDC058145]|uniref:hypothetical protein n=1 Tax=Streptomyces sp. NPDC058145 TaxID=3346356 RepID=UPI0036EE5EBF
MVLTGATIPPLLVLFPVLTESTVRRAVLTQAFSWLGSAGAAGSAAAAAVPGWAIDQHRVGGGFVVTAMAATAMTVQSLAGLRLPRPTGERSVMTRRTVMAENRYPGVGRVVEGGPAGGSSQAGQPVGDTALPQCLGYGFGE